MSVGDQATAGFGLRLARQTVIVFSKDMTLEWRGRARLISVLVFGIVTLMLFSFAVGPDTIKLREAAPGFLILALLLSSTLALGESFRVERERRALEGLLLLPIEPTALFFGKALGNAFFLGFLGPILCPAALVLYSVDLDASRLLQLGGLWFLTSLGLSAPGTLYAGMTSRIRSQDVLLPVLLFPLVVPILMASVKAMALVMRGDAMNQLGSWTLMIVAFNVIYWPVCGVLFPQIVEEGA